MEIIYIGLLSLILGLSLSLKFDLRHSSKRLASGHQRQVLLDTSALIDGRILSLAQSGFIGDKLLIPRSVVAELQLLADSSDSDKRSRARYGLDIISALQKTDDLTVEILADSSFTPEGVDNRLLELAKAAGYLVCTLDFNLNKVAKIEGIKVLNINELAQNLRLQILPGETAKIKLTQAGQGDDQAVGYLSDGTMVVVANAKKMLGQVVSIEATRSIQTEAGKMLFAELSKTKPQRSTESATNSLAKQTSTSKRRHNTRPQRAKQSSTSKRRQTTTSSHSAEKRLLAAIDRQKN